jgi:hypothetical protein
MGSLRGGSPDKVPIPEKKFVVTFIDQSDVLTECRDASIEGSTFIEGKRGEGKYTISFDNISSAVFMFNEDKLRSVITMRDGNTAELVLNKDHKAYGLTRYGTYQIKLSDLKKMSIGVSSQKSQK